MPSNEFSATQPGAFNSSAHPSTPFGTSSVTPTPPSYESLLGLERTPTSAFTPYSSEPRLPANEQSGASRAAPNNQRRLDDVSAFDDGFSEQELALAKELSLQDQRRPAARELVPYQSLGSNRSARHYSNYALVPYRPRHTTSARPPLDNDQLTKAEKLTIKKSAKQAERARNNDLKEQYKLIAAVNGDDAWLISERDAKVRSQLNLSLEEEVRHFTMSCESLKGRLNTIAHRQRKPTNMDYKACQEQFTTLLNERKRISNMPRTDAFYQRDSQKIDTDLKYLGQQNVLTIMADAIRLIDLYSDSAISAQEMDGAMSLDKIRKEWGEDLSSDSYSQDDDFAKFV